MWIYLKTWQTLAGFIQFCMMVFGISLFLDSMDRRPTMIIGSLGLDFSRLIITILLQYNTYETSVAAAIFFVYMSFFGATMNFPGCTFQRFIASIQSTRSIDWNLF